MLHFYVIYQVIQVCALFGWYSYGVYQLASNSLLFISYLLLEALLVYVILYFELSSFTLKSNISGDGSVQIIGVDPNGKELFRFRIDEQAMQNQKLLAGSNRQKDGVHVSYRTTNNAESNQINKTKSSDKLCLTKVSSDDFSDDESVSRSDNRQHQTDND